MSGNRGPLQPLWVGLLWAGLGLFLSFLWCGGALVPKPGILGYLFRVMIVCLYAGAALVFWDNISARRGDD